MDRFKSGETDILVATTVIEVGVDVPNATVMVIEHAERFGLSQLHQLRGRVGRGGDQSYCFLMADYKRTADSQERLEAMVATTDGFVISETDLQHPRRGRLLRDTPVWPARPQDRRRGPRRTRSSARRARPPSRSWNPTPISVRQRPLAPASTSRARRRRAWASHAWDSAGAARDRQRPLAQGAPGKTKNPASPFDL